MPTSSEDNPVIRPLKVLLASVVVVAPLGCDQDPRAPSVIKSDPALAAAAATTALSFLQVSAGGGPSEPGHACGVATDGEPTAGAITRTASLERNERGPGRLQRLALQPAAGSGAGGLRFRHVSAGGRSTCGITTDDRAYCWGRNASGQLGDGNETMRLRPVQVAGGRRFRQVTVGNGHACAINTLNVAYCWGYNVHGHLGDRTIFGAVPRCG